MEYKCKYPLWKAIVVATTIVITTAACASKSTFLQKEVPAPKTEEVSTITKEADNITKQSGAIVTASQSIDGSVERINLSLEGIEALNNALKPIQGKKVEGTGITVDWFSISSIFIIGGVIALMALVPAIIPLLLTIFRKLFSGTLNVVTSAIDSLPAEATMSDLKAELEAKMDQKHKNEIINIQTKLKKNKLKP